MKLPSRLNGIAMALPHAAYEQWARWRLLSAGPTLSALADRPRTRFHQTILTTFVSVCVSRLEEAEHLGVPVWRHLDVPECRPNIVYVDGPALTPERQVAVDVLDIEDRLPGGAVVVVDGRWQNVAFLRQHLKRAMAYRRRYIVSTWGFIVE